MRMIENFQRWKANLSSWVDLAIDESYKYSYPDYSYKDSKRKIENLEVLKILDNKEDFNMRRKNGRIESIVYGLIAIFVTTIFFRYFPNHKVTNENLIPSGFYLLFLLSLLLIVMFFVVKWLVNRLHKFSLLIPLTVWPLFFSDFIDRVFRDYNLEKDYILNITIIVFVSIIIYTLLYFIIKYLSVFETETSSSNPALILSILAISTIVFEVDLSRRPKWALIVLFLTISSTILEWIINKKVNEANKIAQEIFQEQLLLDAPDYKKLKKCYFYGGEKYKEKLLSTEKFLKVIVKNELKSLKDLKTYDDYKLYKTYKGRSYL